MQTIQIHLSQKLKIFSEFFLHFSNLHWISNIFKKDDPHSYCISEITDHERRA